MNRNSILVAVCVFAAITLAAVVGLKYVFVSMLFAVLAAGLAPVAVHKVPDSNVAVGLLVGLAIFAAYPLKKLFHLDTLVAYLLVTFACMAALWVIGFGWKRSWK